MQKREISGLICQESYLCPMPVYQLRDLNQHIRETIADSYPEELWVRAEIASINPNKSSGHCYLELSDEGSRMRAMIWKSTYTELSSRFERETGRQLEAGMQVQILVKVEFSVQYSMGLVIRDLDTAFSVGELAMRRARTLERLRNEGLLQENKNRIPGFPPFRIAMITSPTAAGYEDFRKHLLENPFRYNYSLHLFPAMMQGAEAIPSLLQAFENIRQAASDFDFAVIIRGGGSRQDLQVFDEYEVAAALAQCPVPVLSGIGHERDESICDVVAWNSFKTPTAVADYILSKSGEAELAVDQLVERMASTLHWAIRSQEQEVVQAVQKAALSLSRKIHQSSMQIQQEVNRIAQFVKDKLHRTELELKGTETALQAGNPMRILELGFARISQEGKRIRVKKEVIAEYPLKISLKDGDIIVKTIT